MMKPIVVTLTLFAALVFAAGCEKHAQGGKNAHVHAGEKTGESAHSHHDQGHNAPHGGVLVELGDHAASVEILVDPKTGSLTLYAFDGCAENAVRLKQESVAVRVVLAGKADAHELTLTARSNALTGEKPGDAAEFEATDDAVKGVAAIEGVIAQIEIKGQKYSNVKFRWSASGE